LIGNIVSGKVDVYSSLQSTSVQKEDNRRINTAATSASKRNDTSFKLNITSSSLKVAVAIDGTASTNSEY